MASIYNLKPKFQARLRPLCRALARRGVTANQVTVAAVILSMLQGGAILIWPDSHAPLIVLPAVLFARLTLNAIDGMLAREHGQKSPLGSLLNELGDVISDSLLYLPLGLVAGFDGFLILAIVLLATWAELAGIASVAIGGSRRYDGPLGKSDRAFAFGLIALLVGFGAPPGPWLVPILWGLVALAVLTLANRIRHALREVSIP